MQEHFHRKLAGRGLRGVKLVVSDAHEGIKAAVSRIFTANWQRCPTPGAADSAWSRSSSPPPSPSNDAEQARAQWRRAADQLRHKVPKLATLMDDAEPDVLAYMNFPARASQRRDQATHRRRWHLPKRGSDRSSCRRHPARAERCVKTTPTPARTFE